MRLTPVKIGIFMLLDLAACNASPDPKICTQIMSQEQFDNENKSSNIYYADLATDCLITKSREYSSSADVSAVVGKAVISACSTLVGFVTSDKFERDAKIWGVAQAAASGDDEQKKWEAAAVRYVIEARTGHCTTHRPTLWVHNVPNIETD